MIMEEIHVLASHGKLGDVKVISELPVYKRRMHLKLLADEAKKREQELDKLRSKSANKASFSRRKM